MSAVARGEGRLDPSVTGVVVQHFRQHTPRPRTGTARPALTAREHEVLSLMTMGMNNAEIAEELAVAPGTVKAHVATVLSKLGARDRLQAVIATFDTGLILP